MIEKVCQLLVDALFHFEYSVPNPLQKSKSKKQKAST